MNEKTILVFYLNSAGDQMAFKRLANDLKNDLDINEEDILPFFVYTEGESKIECINPRLVGKEGYEKVKKLLEELEETMKRLKEKEEE